jgi:hypothetical protein
MKFRKIIHRFHSINKVIKNMLKDRILNKKITISSIRDIWVYNMDQVEEKNIIRNIENLEK